MYGVRLFFIAVYMVTVTVSSWELTTFQEVYFLFYYLCAAYGALTVLALVLHQIVKKVRRFLVIQAVVDALFLLMMLYLTGGHQSLAIPMLDVHIVFAVFLLGRSLGRKLILLVSSGVCFIGSIYLGHQSGDPLPWVLPQWAMVEDLQRLPTIGQILIDCASFIVLGELSGQLSDMLNRARVVTRDVLDPLVQGVMVTDPEGRVLQINPAFIRLTGSRLDLLNKLLEGGDLPEEILDLIFGEREDYVEVDLEVEGEAVPVACHVLPMIGGSQRRYLGMVLTLTDMSDHEQIEKMKRQQQRSEAISTLASGIAHEVRNPLAAMRSALQILEENYISPNDEQKRMLELIVKEGDRLDHIVGSFLDFSKLKPRVLAHTSLTGLIAETVNLLELDPKRLGCEIVNEISEDLFATVDPEQVKQVILNLGLNAFQAMTSCGKGAKLIFRGRQEAGAIVIEVLDEGPGVSLEAKDRLFDPFFTTKAEGTGMGLATVDRIVRAHGGHISVKNLPEGGCRFDIEFPAVAT